MDLNDLIGLYRSLQKERSEDAPKHLSELFRRAKEQHKRDFQGTDHEQSWRAFKGKNVEKLVRYILTEDMKKLGLRIVEGNALERTTETNLPEDLAKVKRQLLIDYGECGYHLPDADLVICLEKSLKVVAVLSIKVTLRERIAQSGYWKLKLGSQKLTQHIHFYFITLDEDETLKTKDPMKKGRAIVETDLDGSYVLSPSPLEESDKVRLFERFISDLRDRIKDFHS